MLGYRDGLGVFAGWDPRSHPNPGTSSSLQVPLSLLKEAAGQGIASRTRLVENGTEVVIAFAPSAIGTYLELLPWLPSPRVNEKGMKAWAQAGNGEQVEEENLPKGHVRREIIREVRVKVRSQRFRSAVIHAYRGRCAFCGLSFGLVEAAHIDGVGEGGADEVTNGLSACPTHHLAFDRGLLFVGESGAVEVNHERLKKLGARPAEIAALKSGLFPILRVPVVGRLRPAPARLAAHRQRWLSS